MISLYFFSMVLWDVVEPVGLVIIAYLLYKNYRELRLIRELLEKQTHSWRSPAIWGGVLRPLGLPLILREPLTGAASLLSPRRQLRGGVGSQPARLAHAQLHFPLVPKVL